MSMRFILRGNCSATPDVDLTILADELTDYEFATDDNGNPWRPRGMLGIARIPCDSLLEIRQHDDPAAPIESDSQTATRRGVVQPCLLQLCHPRETHLPHLPGFLRRLWPGPQAFTLISRCTISSSMSILPQPACAASASSAWAPMWLPGLY